MMLNVGCESLENRTLLSAALDSKGALHVVGSAGADVIGIRAVVTSLNVDLNGSVSTFLLAAVKSISIDLGEGNDRLDIAAGVGAFYCLGGLGSDTINGGDGSDSITAGGGKDFVTGGAGDDRIDGGPTADFLDGGAGADRIYGSDANDILAGGPGVDRLFAGPGNDQLIGGSSNDKLYGDDGNDTLNGNNQNDLLTGGIGDDLILGGDGNDTLNGQDGDDELQGQAGNDIAFGDAGADYILDGAGDDSLTGGMDDDFISGFDGNDTLRGNEGDDWLDGGYENDSLDGGDGFDSLSGGVSHDQLSGGSGDDALLGGRDEDTMTGGAGADRFLNRVKDTTTDKTSADVLLNFNDGNLLWTDDEIWKIDVGLKWLQQRTGGVKILKRSDGADLIVERDSNVGTDILGDNDGEGTIRIADLTFEYDGFYGPDVTIIHEIGHNWDTEQTNPTIGSFRDLSKWRESGDDWTHDPKAQFSRDYGKTNPREDFATALEVYYSPYNAAINWQAKWDWIDNWLDTM